MPRSKRTSPWITEIEHLGAVRERREDLSHCVVQGLDLAGVEIDWATVALEGAVFLGCRFGAPEDLQTAIDRGALVFPTFDDLPYDPYRPSLYDRAELLAPIDRQEEKEGEGGRASQLTTRDLEIYRHFERTGRHLPDIREALAQRLHDHAIDDAVRDFLDFGSDGLPQRKAVGIMGGHRLLRSSETFRQIAEIARELTRSGFLVVTGGGPGAMEAGNLGAYLAPEDDDALDQALSKLRRVVGYREDGYTECALEVIDSVPEGAESLAVPTWFYGHEPTNVFATAIAKYFSNSLREDGLLAVCLYGVLFAPGSAGTLQEVFQDAAQNHYTTFGQRSPMVFFGRDTFAGPGGAYPVVARLGSEGGYGDLLLVSDSVSEVVDFICANPPRPA